MRVATAAGPATAPAQTLVTRGDDGSDSHEFRFDY